jgi:hypothetical protein
MSCGMVLGHGQSCVDGYECSNCTRISELESAIKDLLDDVNARYPDKEESSWTCPYFQKLSDLTQYGKKSEVPDLDGIFDQKA